jgi:hypothetical protein
MASPVERSNERRGLYLEKLNGNDKECDDDIEI